MRRKRRQDVRDLRDGLIEAAFATLESDGLTRVTVRAAARRLDVATTAAARCFPTRCALVTAMAVETLRELTQVIEDAAAAPAPPYGENALAVAGAVTAYARRAPNRYALCWRFDEIRPQDECWQAAGEALTRRMNDVLSAHGVYPPASLVVVGSMLNGFVELCESGAIESARCLFIQRRRSDGFAEAPAPFV